MNELILVAEDEPEIVTILEAYLAREGFRTVSAADGQVALDQHAILKPDLVLLDVNMPKVDGWEVLTELRRRGGDHGHGARRGHRSTAGTASRRR